MKKLLINLFTAMITSLAIPAASWAWQPTQPVKIVLGANPGTSFENALRKITAKIEETTGTKYVFEHKPGAGQLAAANYFISQPADGHTLYMPVSGEVFVLAPVNFKDQVKWNINSFEYVINYANGFLVLVTHIDTPVSNPKEFLAYVKNSKTPLNIASGQGFQAVGYEYLVSTSDIDKKLLNQILYKTATEAVKDISGKHIEFGLIPSGALAPALATGKIKVVGIASNSKFPTKPEYELLSSTVPGMNLELIRGIVLPKGSTPEMVQWHNNAFRRVLNSPEIIKAFADHYEYIDSNRLAPEDYKKAAVDSNKKWTPFAEKLSK